MDRSQDIISIIIPTINEELSLASAIQAAREGGKGIEIIVADGGSSDHTVEIAHSLQVKVVHSKPGRARQMNAGVRDAHGNILLFLHADTLLPKGYDTCVRRILSAPSIAVGAFRLALDAPGISLRLIELGANLRSRYLKLPYGDQALFMSRRRFEQAGGFPEIPLMEDFSLLREMKKRGQVVLAPMEVKTSARRWLRRGIWPVTILNQCIVAAYLVGVSPERLVGWYRRQKKRHKDAE